MKKNIIAIYGAGGFGREVAWLAQTVSNSINNFKPVCFIDDDKKICGTKLNGLKVLSLRQAKNQYPGAYIICGIGSPAGREAAIHKAATMGFNIATLIHPRVEMSKWIKIGVGTVICSGCVLTTNITLAKHVQINLNCTIGHNVFIDDYATLAPGVHVSGYVNIGKRVYIGTGAVIINGTDDEPISIGDGSIIGAGACVIKSIPAEETWAGVPAKMIKTSNIKKR
jgi:sugar O-acyltransferase (sialic acid O-acetyltransferase NeuD family)